MTFFPIKNSYTICYFKPNGAETRIFKTIIIITMAPDALAMPWALIQY